LLYGKRQDSSDPDKRMDVLALEYDPAQAAAIQHVVCDLVGAKLRLVTSMSQALRALGEDTPDLILLPALVSPSEEAELLAVLRARPGGAHIETQITPVLAVRSELAPTTVWRRWRSRRAPASSAADDRQWFAERLAWSLEQARERRQYENLDGRRLFDIASPLIVEPAGSLVSLLQTADSGRSAAQHRLVLEDSTSRLLDKLHPERRQHRRLAARELPGLQSARIKFGPYVAVVDVSPGGALIETDARLTPESEAMLEIFGNGRNAIVPFRVLRSRAANLDGSPRYLGACAFTQHLRLDELSVPPGPAFRVVPKRLEAHNSW
jgi:hypothetical protein